MSHGEEGRRRQKPVLHPADILGADLEIVLPDHLLGELRPPAIAVFHGIIGPDVDQLAQFPAFGLEVAEEVPLDLALQLERLTAVELREVAHLAGNDRISAMLDKHEVTS
ncbi:hypothetical protein AGR7A_pAt20267 [Agrobacterium deltaense NCPPB 1641]|uniref:Uncharacterized protein n=1 Tax=Agrobacterium deltaense NCPPB 1641 TaxID=1183425 RepID=A0A1S7U9N9_9HYPH|nr:hypothetical protein AGR7A_pAt20267 [Agrobacterium deltaense NCPPB 1641]